MASLNIEARPVAARSRTHPHPTRNNKHTHGRVTLRSTDNPSSDNCGAWASSSPLELPRAQCRRPCPSYLDRTAPLPFLHFATAAGHLTPLLFPHFIPSTALTGRHLAAARRVTQYVQGLRGGCKRTWVPSSLEQCQHQHHHHQL